ncbi:VCBS repeat-containing protein [Spirosoma montaniterrae]|uniref:RNA-binding protein n=1 Tax=Spirosoma montaniterrae TaxID=1178516 RepID=A0A1P9WTK3_9BACT|nr:VCBS repeat-containing protein [Spirosoma montaniterrae]AQG78714.1 RNA-binding protein [Spirosoma montaniterrae]
MFIRSLPLLLLILAGCHQKPTLFRKIDSDDSGVDFANTITASDSLNAFTFTNFYNGGGVGVGDFNRDGRPDLFFSGNQVSCRLYLNQTDSTRLGELRFQDITESAGVTTSRWCTGVSVVDINQDGWDDVYVSVAAHQHLKESRNLLFINQRTPVPTFREEAARYGLDYAGFTTQAAFFDYDRDGDLDCFLLNTAPDLQNPNRLRPALNDGTDPSTDKLYRNLMSERAKGRKSERVKECGPRSAKGESAIDSLFHSLPNAARTLSLFEDVSNEAGIRYEGLGLGVVVSDLNGDGWPDLYGSNDFLSSDVLYLNQRNGTFANVIRSATAHTSLFGMGIDAGDLNNDGRPDLLQLDMLPESNQRLKQMLAGQDYDKKELSLRPQYGYQLQYMRNTLQLNTGNQDGLPIFSEMGLLAGLARTDWSWAVLLADLDLDGHRDVFITNGYRKNVTDRDFINFTEEFDLFGSDEARQQQRDKLVDKIPEVQLRNYAFRNQQGDSATNLTFEDVSAAWGLDELSYANGAAYADLDRDGDLDLIVNNIDQAASIFQNTTRDQGGNNFLTVSFDGGSGNRAGLGASLTVWTNGQLQHYENQPVRGYLSSVQPGIIVGAGQQTRLDSVQVRWPDGRRETRYRVPTNQRLVFRASDSRAVDAAPRNDVRPIFQADTSRFSFTHQESDFVDFKTTPALHKMFSRGGPAVGVGDLNGDGISDVVVGPSYRGSGGMLFFGERNGNFRAQNWLTNSPLEAGDVLLFDADADRDLDVLLVGGGNERPATVAEAYQPVLYLNDGRGTLTPSPNALPRLNVSSQAARAFDYDRDGDADLLLTGRQLPGRYPTPASSYLLRNDEGPGGVRHFADVTAQVAPDLMNLGLVCDALPLDADRDGDTDVVLVGEWMAPILMLNHQAKFTLSLFRSFTHSSGWWNCVSAGDFDHDGDPDLLLGNEGLNTIYRASAAEPVRIIAKDFNNDGQMDPIMGYYLQGRCYPAPPREALNQQVIQFRRKYQRYADYAEVTFDELFGPEERAGAWSGQATELRSCYAENLGNGNFRLQPLPILAQQAPVASFVLDDFNRDGHLDALVTGNFYPNEVNMGRQDASQGLLLTGNGKGGFTAIGSDVTGLRLWGDVRKSYRLQPGRRVITAVNGKGLSMHSW